MDWYDISNFGDNLQSIEQFFIEIAANEELLRIYGFEYALKFNTATSAIEKLKKFQEDFSALRRVALRIDRSLGQDILALESDGKLSEQVSLIYLRLRMAEARKPMTTAFVTVHGVIKYFPFFYKFTRKESLFGDEPVSLHKTIINLGRLRGLSLNLANLHANKGVSDNEVFKPSNVSSDKVLDLIDEALGEISKLTSLSPAEREKIEGYLFEAKKEASASVPSWSKIVGALVIVAAITSGLADAPNATRTVKDVIEYILGTSVEKPLQKYLPSPKTPTDEQATPTLIA